MLQLHCRSRVASTLKSTVCTEMTATFDLALEVKGQFQIFRSKLSSLAWPAPFGIVKGLYTKEEGMQLPMVAIQTAKCKSLLKIATFSISAWAGEDWTFVALWFCVVVKSSGVLGECI